MMFGRPGLSNAVWKDELISILSDRCPNLPHLSLYELTPERGTPLWKHDLHRLPSEDIKAEQYEIAVESASKFGLARYEVSNFARDEESRSKHNTWYWRGGNFLGLGPGAHSRYYLEGRRVAAVQAPFPKDWMTLVKASGHGTMRATRQNLYDIAAEILGSTLRTSWGLESDLFGLFFPDLLLFDLVRDCQICQQFQEDGLMTVSERRIKLTPKGLAFADYISPYLLANFEKSTKKT